MIFSIGVACLLAGACAEGAAPSQARVVPFRELVANPEGFDGERVTVRAAYYSSFEVSVLTSGVADTDPPTPRESLLWVAASPPDQCLVAGEAGAFWAKRVVATGLFRHDPRGGFGHLGAYPMTIQDVRLSCAGTGGAPSSREYH